MKPVLVLKKRAICVMMVVVVVGSGGSPNRAVSEIDGSLFLFVLGKEVRSSSGRASATIARGP